MREPAETHCVRQGLGRGDVLGSLGTLLHLALGGSLMVSGDRAVWVKSQFTFAYAGPMFEMPIATMSGEMTAREGVGVQQSLQHASVGEES